MQIQIIRKRAKDEVEILRKHHQNRDDSMLKVLSTHSEKMVNFESMWNKIEKTVHNSNKTHIAHHYKAILQDIGDLSSQASSKSFTLTMPSFKEEPGWCIDGEP